MFVEKFYSPFPFSRGFKNEILSAIKICLVATVFLLLLRPFGLEDVSSSVVLGFGITILISAIINLLISYLAIRPIIKEEDWKVWKEVLRILFYLFINVLAIYFYARYNIELEADQFILIKFIGYTFLFAIIPISLRVISTNNMLLKKQLQNVTSLKESIESEKDKITNETMLLRSNIVKDTVEINLDSLLFIEAEKNYITIIQENEKGIYKKLLRLSLVKAQDQITQKSIIRCHRSYLININSIKSVSGNSQGLKLNFSEGLPEIPISRKYKEEVMRAIKNDKHLI